MIHFVSWDGTKHDFLKTEYWEQIKHLIIKPTAIPVKIGALKPQFYIQLVFKAPLCITLTISWVVAYFFYFFYFFKKKKKKYHKSRFM
jgi:hypothetical protein